MKPNPLFRFLKPAAAGSRGPVLALAFLCASGIFNARGEAMLELFNVPWAQLTQKIPEIAEAGYDSLWVPNPAKGDSGIYSVGYDPYDRFDLGSVNQRGSTATQWGTEAELLQMVQTAHRFGIRVYFDNVMNHNGGTVPGFNANTPTNYYPGFTVQDFHLQTSGKYYVAWPSLGSSDPTESLYGGNDYCDQWRVQNYTLLGLVDIATEPGSLNYNFGATPASTTTKPFFIRQPAHPEFYMNTNGVSLGAKMHPFTVNGAPGQPVPEYVEDYLNRAAAWTLYTTKCDGFRLDAVKHVPSTFFSTYASFTDDPTFSGYTGAIQAMYDWVHGYGNNVCSNGYVETDGNRNSLFNTESPRNDAMIFGEHVSTPPNYQDYLNAGMRLCNQPLYTHFYAAMTGNAGLNGMDGRDYTPPSESPCGEGPFSTYSAAEAVNFSMTQDGGSCCPPNAALEDAWDFMHEGLPMFYSDGYNHAAGGFPNIAYNNYLGEFNDNRMPDTAYTHNQLSRGGTWSRWSDQNILFFERYDYREGTNTLPQYQDVALFGMNDKTSYPGDIAFDDGISRTSDGYYLVATNTPDGSATADVSIPNSRGQGIVVGFPPGSVLVQLASSADVTGGSRAFHRLLVHGATQSYSTAQSTAAASDPTQRLIYVGGQTLASGGGAVELVVPSGAWVIYGYQWPEASRANAATNAIIFLQGGNPVPYVTVYRTDGVNGQTNYSPQFPFKMRGSVDPYTGNPVIAPGEGNVSNRTYAIQVPVLTNGPFDIIVRSDASAVNTLMKLDGGIDLNSQMGLGPTNGGVGPTGPDLRDNRPGYATDVFLGYEQTAFQYRNGPEKFAARNIASNNIVSFGAETYIYTVGGTNTVVAGAGRGGAITNQTANWVFHDPAVATTILTNAALPVTPATQMVPTNPAAAQPVTIYVKVGYQFQINTCFIYYTTDGSNPEGAFGTGKGTTHVVQGNWVNHDSVQSNIDWWAATIPAQANGTQVRYKIALFNGGSYGYSIGNTTNWPSILPISDAEPQGSKLYGLTQAAVTNFNPTTAVVWLHNDLNTNNTAIGLQSGYHIVRARTFLPRTNESSVYNTFLQTFYYDAGPPAAVFVNPPTNNYTVSNNTYQVIVRADSSATELDYNIIDTDTNNDDIVTHQNNGNGLSNGVPVFVPIAPSTPTGSLNTTYSNYPVEFRFTYVAVPTNGTATITVHLKKATTALFPGRVTALTNVVNTAAPSQFIQISDPASDGMTLILGPNNTYTIDACFSSTLSGAANIDYFSIFINGVYQPRRDTFGSPLYTIDSTGGSCGAGLKLLSYSWTGALPGTNVIQVLYTNNVIISGLRTVAVVAPPAITGISGSTNSPYITWSSYSNVYYQVLATTNLSYPFAPLGTPVPGSSGSATFNDPSPDPFSKFYEIEILP